MAYYFEGQIRLAYILLCVCILLFATIKTKNNQVLFLVLSSVMCLYLFFVIKITQFPILAGEIYAEDLGGHYWRSINLIPFKGSFNLGSIQNIIMTMPLGFLVPLIRTKATSLKQIALVGILAGLIIEAMQLMQLLINTFTFRVIDVNDVLFNFCGVLIGFFCFKIMRSIILLMNLRQPPETEPSELVSYFNVR